MSEPVTKRCTKCTTEKPASDFSKSGKYLRSWCRACESIYQKARYDQDPARVSQRAKDWRERYAEKYKQYRKESRPKHYIQELSRKRGISVAEVTKLLEEGGENCAICKDAFSSHVRRNLDHCHETGRVREFICTRCNSVIGLAKDDKDLLSACINYLEKHGK